MMTQPEHLHANDIRRHCSSITFFCHECLPDHFLKFTDYVELTDHLKAAHEYSSERIAAGHAAGAYPCRNCGESFKSLDTYDRHKEKICPYRIREEEEEPVEKKRKMKFKEQEDEEEEDEQLKCKKCDYQAKSLYGLFVHIQKYCGKPDKRGKFMSYGKKNNPNNFFPHWAR